MVQRRWMWIGGGAASLMVVGALAGPPKDEESVRADVAAAAAAATTETRRTEVQMTSSLPPPTAPPPASTVPPPTQAAMTTLAPATTLAPTTLPPAPTYALGTPVDCGMAASVELGSTGEDVRCFERRLQQISANSVPFVVDTVFGEDTAAAVAEFQTRLGLFVDGSVGEQTASRLGIWAPPPPPPVFQPVLPQTPEPQAPSAQEDAGDTGDGCTPDYDPCLPPASDYDCEGGPGDGPRYTGRVSVSGSDPYGLDGNDDGIGC